MNHAQNVTPEVRLHRGVGVLVLVGCVAALWVLVTWVPVPSPFVGSPAQAQGTRNERLVVRLAKQVANLTWFDENTLLATTPDLGGTSRTGLIDVKTGEIRALSPGFCASPSPDRSRLALVQGRASVVSGDAWILDLHTGGRRQLTADLRVTCLSWSPDGRWIALLVSPWGEGQDQIVVISADNGRTAYTLTGGDLRIGEIAWAPDSQRLVFVASRSVWTSLSPPKLDFPVRRIDLYNLQERRRTTYLDVGRGETDLGRLAFRPDGQTLLFVAFRPAQIVASDGHTVVPLTPGHDVAWHPSGKTLFVARGYECTLGGVVCAGDDLYLVDY